MTPFLVMVCGTARSGKDSFAEALRATPGVWQRVALGDGVRLELAELTGASLHEQNAHRAQWRKVWQVWGTECRRRLFDENWWVRKWKARAALCPVGSSIVVPDVRFANEMDELCGWALDHGRVPRIVHVRRSRVWELAQLFRRSRWHESEREWRRALRARLYDTVWNTGTLDDLEEATQRLVVKWNTELAKP